jgi:hypothetical protein
MLGGLEVRRIRRQEEQVDMLRNAQPCTGVPPRALQDEDDLLGGSGADLVRERGHLDREERDRHARRQVKDRAARGRMDETDQVPPVVAVLDRRKRALPVEAPDLVPDRLQANPVLVSEVDGPEFHLGMWVRGRDRLDKRPQLFLTAACCLGSARTWRGRGLRRLPSRRTR